MSELDVSLIEPHLERVPLELREKIEEADQTIPYVHFPESGIVSVVAKSGGHQIEAGVIGREGVTGVAVIMGNHRSPNEVYVQVAGESHRIAADALREAIEASATLRMHLQRFVQVFMTQVAQAALANGRAKIAERLARWLLMAHDRVDDEDLRLTHEFIAIMLGVRRPGVTDALNELEGRGLIRSARGSIRVKDRSGLELVAGGTYGVPEAEYRRLIG
jgi:CRP-like cAMP-binding protein